MAQGVSNLMGSFMSCLPMSGSLSRSLVQVRCIDTSLLVSVENVFPAQESSGCRSQLTGFTSAMLLLGVLLLLGPLFQVFKCSPLS